MTDSDRLKLVIEWSKMTPNEFAKSLGYDRAMTIYNVLNGKATISVKLCAKICTKYPEFNYSWILKEEGKMLLKPDYKENTETPINPNINTNYKSMKQLSNEERIDRLLDQNDKLIEILHFQASTISNLSSSIQGGDQSKKARAGA